MEKIARMCASAVSMIARAKRHRAEHVGDVAALGLKAVEDRARLGADLCGSKGRMRGMGKPPVGVWREMMHDRGIAVGIVSGLAFDGQLQVGRNFDALVKAAVDGRRAGADDAVAVAADALDEEDLFAAA